MRSLITPAEVLSSAFSPEEMYTSAAVSELDIAAAEERYLVPVLGRALYDKLLAGNYQSLRLNYIIPQVAAWTRYMVEPLLASRCHVCHTAKPSAAENEALEERRRSLKLQARALTRALVEHLNTSAALYAEYNPTNNPLNRCSIDGNIVQVY